MFQTDWVAISARITGIARSGEVLAVAFSHSDSDGGIMTWLKNQSTQIRVLLTQFLKTHEGTLPEAARASVNAYLAGEDPKSGSTSHRAAMLVMRMIGVESEVTYHLASSDKALRDATVVAFKHLQRLIAVDPLMRRSWSDAFTKNEVACERLGATHLLWHGILAFKADATGARTDLVFGGPIHEDNGLASAAKGLVLTEWKLVRKTESGEAKAAEARRQTVNYATGGLMATELRSRRFVVLVSDKQLPPLSDEVVGVVTWEHIVISVNPQTPSAAARKDKN